LKALHLLEWILCEQRFTLKLIPLKEYERLQRKSETKHAKQYPAPSYVFEVSERLDENRLQLSFRELSLRYGFLYGFHGSSLENIHSIVSNGLQLKFSKEDSLFGKGIYLAFDKTICETFLRFGTAWKGCSILSDRIGVIIGCEAVQHPNQTRLVGSSLDNMNNLNNQNKISSYSGEFSCQEHIGNGAYMIVENDSLLSVRHLLVFEQRTLMNAGSLDSRKENRLHWIFRGNWKPKLLSNGQWVSIVLLLYFILLLLIPYWKSLTFQMESKFLSFASI